MAATARLLDDVEEHVLERRLHHGASTSPRCRPPRAAARAARRAVRASPLSTACTAVPKTLVFSTSGSAIEQPHGLDRVRRAALRRSCGRRTRASARRSCRCAARRPPWMIASAVAVLGLVEIVRRDEHGDADAGRGRSMRLQNSRRDSGSTPPVGSSRKTIGGSWRIAQPSARRWRQPPARSPRRVCSRPSSPAISSTKRRRASSRRAIEAVDAAEEADVLVDGQPLVEREALRHVADAALDAFRIAADVDAADRRRAARRLAAGRTACGSSSTCRRRCCRGSRRSRPGATSNVSRSTATKSPKRCVRSVTVMAFIVPAPAPAAHRRGARWRSPACDRARPAGARPARRARRCWWRRRPRTARRARGAPRSRCARRRPAASMAARGSTRSRRRRWRTSTAERRVEVGEPRLDRAPERRVASAASLRARPPSKIGQLTLTLASHDGCHASSRGKMRGFGPRVVDAAADADGRLAAGRAPRSPRSPAAAHALDERRALRPLLAARCRRSAVERIGSDAGGASASPRLRSACPAPNSDKPRELGFGDLARRAGLHRQHPLPRFLRLDGEDVVRRNESGGELIAHVLRWASTRVTRFLDDAQRLGRGDQRPVRARDLERQIGARRRDLVAPTRSRRCARLARARRSGRPCRSATAGRGRVR